MAYYLDLYSPDTYETFTASDRTVTGFRQRHKNTAQRVHPGDRLICYMTKLSRWIGVLEVVSESFTDLQTQIFANQDDPFTVRFKVKPLIWLPKNHTIPIHEDEVWETLSFTKGLPKNSLAWTGKVRGSLTSISDKDGRFLESLLASQLTAPTSYPIDENEYQRFLSQRVQGLGKTVSVAIPEDSEKQEMTDSDEVRQSIKIQALLAQIGDMMGDTIWIPKNDRTQVLREWKAGSDKLIDRLPLNYDQATLRTIEQIDVIWLKRRSIIRAFEVEHTTAVYSGILRMADLLALQPNMDIHLHIVAPATRRDKVFQEIQRPVFSLLERGPLSETCTFISYDSLQELGRQKHLTYLSDSVLEEYEEVIE